MATILYGSLCAIPQRNLKRLMGYSSISNSGYLLIGVAALGAAGQAAVLYYLSGYLFTVLAAFAVIVLVMRKLDSEDITALAGLNQRSPLLAATLTLSMVSLAGIPPLAGFFGKFLLLKAAVEQNTTANYYLVGVTLFGVVVSIYYYFGVVKAIYWSKDAPDLSPTEISERGDEVGGRGGESFHRGEDVRRTARKATPSPDPGDEPGPTPHPGPLSSLEGSGDGEPYGRVGWIC
jgi:NADH-quinone oxidoreductase subunit N